MPPVWADHGVVRRLAVLLRGVDCGVGDAGGAGHRAGREARERAGDPEVEGQHRPGAGVGDAGSGQHRVPRGAAQVHRAGHHALRRRAAVAGDAGREWTDDEQGQGSDRHPRRPGRRTMRDGRVRRIRWGLQLRHWRHPAGDPGGRVSAVAFSAKVAANVSARSRTSGLPGHEAAQLGQRLAQGLAEIGSPGAGDPASEPDPEHRDARLGRRAGPRPAARRARPAPRPARRRAAAILISSRSISSGLAWITDCRRLAWAWSPPSIGGRGVERGRRPPRAAAPRRGASATRRDHGRLEELASRANSTSRLSAK